VTIGEASANLGWSAELPPEEAALWRAFAQDQPAATREKLFATYFPFARQIATRHFLDRRSGDIEFADLSQLASAGLLEAIDRYDPAFGVPFKRYAGRRISGSIIDGIATMSEVRQQVSFRNRVRTERARSLCDVDTADMPTADAMQMLIDVAVGLALGFMLEGTGLYQAEGERDSGANAYESLVWKETMQRIMTEVAALPEREQNIIRRHYLDGLNFEQIGALLGVSKGRVSQLHKASVGLLKKRLLGSNAFKLER